MKLMQKIAVRRGALCVLLIALNADRVFAETSARPATRPEGRDHHRPPRGGPRFESRRMGPGPEQELTPEQIERLMNFMLENFPEVHERLAGARQDPALFRRMLRRTARIAFPILRASQEDPDLAHKMIAEQKARMALERLGRQYRATNDPQEREELRARIREQTIVRFERRLDRLRVEIQSLQRRLDEARQDLATQEKDKQSLIDERVDKFLKQLDSSDNPRH